MPRFRVALLLAGAFAAATSACGGDAPSDGNTVTPVPTKVEAVTGTPQTGAVGAPLSQPLVVRVLDQADQPLPGASVAFTVGQDGGSVSPPNGTTGADGQFSTVWTLGTKTGSFQVTATVTGTSRTTVYTAKANPGPPNNVAKVSGDNQFGYKGTKLAALVGVRVRDQYGNGVGSVAVQFAAAPGNGDVDSSIAFTDSAGVARSGWTMPGTAATVTLTASATGSGGAPLLGSPATFTAISHNVRVTSVAPTTMIEGQSAVLNGDGFDAANTENLVAIDGLSAAITGATTNQLTVTVPSSDCRPSRTVTVQVTVGGVPAAPFPSPVRPAAFLSLAVGQQLILTDPAQFCLQFPETSGSEAYLIGVQSTSEVVTTLTPFNLAAVAATPAPPAPVWQGAAPRTGMASPPPGLIARLRRRRSYAQAEVRQREFDRSVFPQARASRILAAPRLLPQGTVDSTVNVGDTLKTIRVVKQSGCGQFDSLTAVVRARGTKGIFVEDVANPGKFVDSQWQAFSQAYDTKIYPADEAEFGTPTDRDQNGRFVIVVTRNVNQRGALGFTTGCDLFPRDGSSFAGSNDGEFFYVISPDPTGSLGSQYSVAQAASDFFDVIGHESVHVIQFGRRMNAGAAEFLPIWAAEGQAVLGEEIVGHAVEGRATGQNIGLGPAANLDDTTSTDFYGTGFVGLGLYYGWDPISMPNVSGRVANAPWECSWLDTPPTNPGPCLGHLDPYGAPWTLFRYISDRFGPTFGGGEAGLQQAIIESPLNGFAALQAVTGVRIDSLLGQWAAMLYVDDLVAGTPAALSLPSWNLYDVFYGTYTLGTRTFFLFPELRLTPVSVGFTSFSNNANVRGASSYYAVISGAGRPATAVKARNPSGGQLAATMRYWLVRLQ